MCISRFTWKTFTYRFVLLGSNICFYWTFIYYVILRGHVLTTVSFNDFKITYCRILLEQNVIYYDDNSPLAYSLITISYCRIFQRHLFITVSPEYINLTKCMSYPSTRTQTFCLNSEDIVYYCIIRCHLLTLVPPCTITYCRILRGGPRWIFLRPRGQKRRTARNNRATFILQ